VPFVVSLIANPLDIVVCAEWLIIYAPVTVRQHALPTPAALSLLVNLYAVLVNFYALSFVKQVSTPASAALSITFIP